MPAVCPGVCSGHTSSVPKRNVSPACTGAMLSAGESPPEAAAPARIRSLSIGLITTSSRGQRLRSLSTSQTWS
jgi:hypothetical protein